MNNWNQTCLMFAWITGLMFVSTAPVWGQATSAPATKPDMARVASLPSQPELTPEEKELKAGWEFIRLAYWKEANATFQSIASKAKAPERKAKALFALGYVAMNKMSGADPQKAKAYYRQIAEDLPDTTVAPWALITLARIDAVPQSRPDKKKRASLREVARKRYSTIIARYPKHMAAAQATLWLGMSYITADNSAADQLRGREILEKYLAKHPTNYLAAAMHKALADYFFLQGEAHTAKAEAINAQNGEANRSEVEFQKARVQWRKAIDHIVQSTEAGLPSVGDKASAYFRIARIAEYRLKNYALALKWYQKLTEEIKRDIRYYPSIMGVKRCRQVLEQKKEASNG